MLKRRLKMIDLSELWKNVLKEYLQGTQRAPESFVPSCAYFKKSRDTKISFAAHMRY